MINQHLAYSVLHLFRAPPLFVLHFMWWDESHTRINSCFFSIKKGNFKSTRNKAYSNKYLLGLFLLFKLYGTVHICIKKIYQKHQKWWVKLLLLSFFSLSNAGNSWFLQQMEITDYYIVIPKVCQNSVPVNQIFIFW